MQRLLLIGAMALITVAAADEQSAPLGALYRAKHPKTIACRSDSSQPPGRDDLHAAHQLPDGAPLPDDCEYLDQGFQIESMGSGPHNWDRKHFDPEHADLVLVGNYRINDPDQGNRRYIFVFLDDMEPVLDNKGQPVEATCSAAIGGFTEHLVAGKDGVVRLRRYQVTTKCVNGQTRVYSKAMN